MLVAKSLLILCTAAVAMARLDYDFHVTNTRNSGFHADDYPVVSRCAGIRQQVAAAAVLREANIASTVREANIASAVHEANIASAVHEANIASAVREANIASAVREANIASAVHEANIASSIRAHEIGSSHAFELYQSGVISARELADLLIYEDLDYDNLPWWASRDTWRSDLDLGDSTYLRRLLAEKYRSDIFYYSNDLVDAFNDVIRQRFDYPVRYSPYDTKSTRQTVVTTQNGLLTKAESRHLIRKAERLNRIYPSVGVQEFIDILLSKRARSMGLDRALLNDVESTTTTTTTGGDGRFVRRVTSSSSSSSSSSSASHHRHRVHPDIQLRMAL